MTACKNWLCDLVRRGNRRESTLPNTCLCSFGEFILPRASSRPSPPKRPVRQGHGGHANPACRCSARDGRRVPVSCTRFEGAYPSVIGEGVAQVDRRLSRRITITSVPASSPSKCCRACGRWYHARAQSSTTGQSCDPPRWKRAASTGHTESVATLVADALLRSLTVTACVETSLAFSGPARWIAVSGWVSAIRVGHRRTCSTCDHR